MPSIYLFQHLIFWYISNRRSTTVLHNKSNQKRRIEINALVNCVCECVANVVLIFRCCGSVSRARTEQHDDIFDLSFFSSSPHHSSFITVIVFIVRSIKVRIDCQRKIEWVRDWSDRESEQEWVSDRKSEFRRKKGKKPHARRHCSIISHKYVNDDDADDEKRIAKHKHIRTHTKKNGSQTIKPDNYISQFNIVEVIKN